LQAHLDLYINLNILKSATARSSLH